MVVEALAVLVNLVNTIPYFPAYRRPSGRSPENGAAGDDDGEEATSTVEPHSGSITERSNASKNDRSSQILYPITSSPKESENEMPGQWLGRGRTAAHSTSMYTLILCQRFTMTSFSRHVMASRLNNVTYEHVSQKARETCSLIFHFSVLLVYYGVKIP